MPVVYSRLLAGGVVDAVGTTLVYTAPEGIVTVVRDIVLLCAAANPGPMGLVVGSGSVFAYLVRVPVPEAALTYHWEGRQVMNPGEEMFVFVATGPVQLRVSGYHLGG